MAKPGELELMRREHGEDAVRQILTKLYANHTTTELADMFNCCHATVLKMMNKVGVPRRDHDEKWIHGRDYSPEWYANQERAKIKGEGHPKWKGGRTVDGEGYVHVYVGDGKYRAEHRLVMEKKLGRKLGSEEHVHHKNRNKQDNRPENLEIIVVDKHEELHEIEDEKD